MMRSRERRWPRRRDRSTIWTMANSSPPRRATVSRSRMQSEQPLGDGPQQRVADRMAERVVDVLEVVEVEAVHHELFAPGRARRSACSILSRNSTRLGRSVSASWRAMCAILASIWRRSVTSSCVATQPPSRMGRLTM